MRRTFLVGLVCAALTMGGCKATDPAIDVTGSWSGTGGGWTLKMDLVQSGHTVTGTGVLSGGGTYDLTVSGGVAGSTLNVSLAQPRYFAATYSGTINGNDITGTLNESGFDNLSLNESRPMRPQVQAP